MNQIQIMRDVPVVTYDGRDYRITGHPSHLFRLLILNNGKTVTKSLIASLHDTDPKMAASKIRYLNRQLGGCPELIENDRPTGYRFAPDGWVVDATEFCTAIQTLDGTFEMREDRPVDPAAAKAEVKAMERVLGYWSANPGAEIPGNWEDKFTRLKSKAEDRLLKARLCTKDHEQIRDAVQELERRVRANEADDLIWRFLLLAYDALGNQVKVASTWAAISQFHHGHPPAALQAVMEGLGNGGANPFRMPSSPSAPHDIARKSFHAAHGSEHPSLLDLCATLGITIASALRLEGSHLTPVACIRRTRSRLYFMGVLSSKWVAEAAVLSEFKQLLARLDAINGDVRFLIIDPDGDGYQRLNELRKGHVSKESIDKLRQLVRDHKSFKVRMYNNLPAFRIIVIDDDVVSFSAYRLAAEAYLTTERGWESPHVVLDPLAPYPLAEAFQLLFLETWEKARPLEAANET
jgi:hypothetical protein